MRVLPFLGLACAALAAPAAGAAGGAQLLVMSRPPGAEVFIDGKAKGTTPLSLMSVSTGAHEIRVVLDGHETWTTKAKLKPGPNTVTAELEKAGPASAGSAASKPTGSAAPARARAEGIEGELQRKVSFEFVETPLSEALTFLQRLTKVSLILDRQAIREKGDTPVTLKVSDEALGHALDRILKLADLDSFVKDGAVYISTGERLRGDGKAGEEAERAGGAEKGNAGGGEEEIPRTIDVPCPCCEGDGLIQETGCHVCEADGYKGADLCVSCRGKGRCPFKCPLCSGYGKSVVGGRGVDCRACKGKGAAICPLCRGTGNIKRANREAAAGRTTTCQACGGEGYEQQQKCRKCTGVGMVKVSHVEGRFIYSRRIPCSVCGGDGLGPPMCPKCGGRGYRGPSGPQRIVTLCPGCFGAGHLFAPCGTCRGRGWYRQR